MKQTLGKWIAAGAVVLLAGCSGMTGYDPSARTLAPSGDRFARAWCEAEAPSGSLVSCNSARVPSVQFGERCVCQDPDRDLLLTGRVVSRPNPARMSAASQAYTDDQN